MSKLETIDGKTTNWCGLWWHPEYNGFSSESINLAQLKQFKGTVRLYVRKNKYFNGGQNGRPNYTFCLRDAQSETFKSIEVFGDPKYDHWIPCHERLPEEETIVLVFANDGFVYTGSRPGDNSCWNVDGYGDGFAAFEAITHWMPLPEPPGSGTDRNNEWVTV